MSTPIDTIELAPPARGRSRTSYRLGRALRRPSVVLALLVVATAIAWAFVPALFTSTSPLYGDVDLRLLPPSREHWFGTDQLGRDLFTRFVHGARPSLQAVAVAVAVSTIGGVVLGLLAGFVGGRLDDVISRFLEVVLAIPGLLLSLAFVAALGFGTIKVGVAVGIAGIPTCARVMRAEVLRIRSSVYVEAASTVGATRRAVVVEHVLPNAVGPVLVLAVLEFGSAILAVSALSFLGFGAPPPAPEWGALVAGGRNYLGSSWWLTVIPGLGVMAVVVSANRLARSLDREGRLR